jgi:maltose O-acetyltransferase
MGDEKAKMLAGELYLPDEPELTADRERCAELCERFNRASAADDAGRLEILRQLLGHLGDQTVINPPFRCDYGYQISLGARSFINFYAILLDCARITIGDDVQIGPGVQLLTAVHPIDPDLRRTRLESGEPITIEDDVWLGGGVIVRPGVTIGAGTVVGAGSVVTKDLPPRVVAVGNPCRVLRPV